MTWFDRLRNVIAGQTLPAPTQQDRLEAAIGKRLVNATTPEQLEEIFRRLEFGNAASSWSGEAVSAGTAMQARAVNSCVLILAESQAMLPLELKRRDPESDQTADATDLPLYDLLKTAPNDWQTSFEWREMGVQHLELRGNFYNLIVRDAIGRVVELIPMHPDRVEPIQDKTTMAVTYRWRRQDGTMVEFPADEVLHIRRMTDEGMIRGVSTIAWHRQTIGESMAVQRQAGRFWSNAARPGAVLIQDPAVEADEGTRKEIRTDFEELYRGSDAAYRTAVLPPGFKLEPLTMTMEDAQFLETRKFNRTEIAGMFRVPPHLIGDLEKSTFSNIENLSLQFVIWTIQPRVVRWEQAMERQLIIDPQLFIRHNLDAVKRGDSKSRNESLQIQRRNGIINANEWRRLEDLDPRTDPGGDRYIVESNMQDDTQDELVQGTGDGLSPSERAAGAPAPAQGDDIEDEGQGTPRDRLRVVGD